MVEKISVKTKIIREEVLIIIGTENKKKELIFPAMGIRKLRTKFAKYPFVRFIIFYWKLYRRSIIKDRTFSYLS